MPNKRAVVRDGHLPSSQAIKVNAPAGRARTPVTGAVPQVKWRFSFQYFNQADLFGLDNTDARWLAAFLTKLKELSNMTFEEVMRGRTKDVLRYHRINWALRGVPVDRTDFHWLPQHIIENERDFPFVQFAVSTALGRVVGFVLETTFYIIVIDRNHNLQPSKRNNYEIRPTSMVESEIEHLLFQLESIKEHTCADPNCTIKAQLHAIHTCHVHPNVFVICLEDDFAVRLMELIDKQFNLRKIIEQAILDSFNEDDGGEISIAAEP